MGSLLNYQWCAMGDANELERPFGLLAESESWEETEDSLDSRKQYPFASFGPFGWKINERCFENHFRYCKQQAPQNLYFWYRGNMIENQGQFEEFIVVNYL